MDQHIIATMEAEEAELSQKLDAVRQFLAVYRGGSSPPDQPRKTVPAKAERPARSMQDRMDKFGPYGQRIVDKVDSLLPGCDDNPVPTRALVEQLEFHGVAITGDNKVNSLSALLARSSKMKGWGRAGWTRSVPEAGANLNKTAADDSQNENEPPSETAGGSDAAGWGVPPPPPASSNPHSRWPS